MVHISDKLILHTVSSSIDIGKHHEKKAFPILYQLHSAARALEQLRI